MRKLLTQTLITCAIAGAIPFMTGCRTGSPQPSQQVSTAPQTPASSPATAPASSAAPTMASGVLRIRAGASSAFTDSGGNVWQPERGFVGGEVVEHDPAVEIANTKEAGLYQTEHYSMDSFECKVANGKYIARLHFAETYDGITGPGERVFSFNVQGREFKDFDVWAKAGGPRRAYVETVPVEVTNGTFKITFTSNVENPQINAIELVRQ